MATTSDQDARTAAAWTDFEMQFFVGADRMLGDIELTAGGSYDPEAYTTLLADIGHDEEDEITVASTTGFTTGFLVVHPYAAGESYELIAYSGTTGTTFTGLTRFETDGDKRIHSTGAIVSEWMDVTDYIYGRVALDLQMDDEVGDWQARITGHSYLSSIFQPDRAFLCMWRFRPSSGSMSSWTSWTVGFIGFLQNIVVDGDWTDGNKWSADVESMGFYLDKTDVGSGVTYGKIDLAENKSTETSSVLIDVYQESASGEFRGTPSLDGDMAVDADMGTLWVSDGEPYPVEETPIASAGNINEVYLRSESWMPDGLQWIELFWKSTQGMAPGGFGGCQLATSYTTWKWTGWDPNGRAPLNNYLDLPKTPVIEIGDTWFGIFTNDKPAFMAHFPTCEADVYDWRGFEIGNFTMDPTGDLLVLRWWGVNTVDIVWWDGGRASWALYDFCGGGSHYYALGGTNYSGWSGAMITTPPIGHSFRSNPTGNKGGTVSYYKQDEDHPTPGYSITGEPEWIIVDLGTLGITLDSALDQGVTTSADVSGCLGLRSSGYVSIDTGGASNEIIKYDAIDRINNQLLSLTRGQYSTSDQDHDAGETVQPYEGGAATDNHLIQTINWKRRPVIGANGVYNVPHKFNVYSTEYETGYPTPTDEEWDDGLGMGGWEDYWKRLYVVTWYAATSWQKTLSAPIRARKVMVMVRQMRDSGRVKLNELSVFGPNGYVLTAGTEDGDWDAGFSSYIIDHLLWTWLGLEEGSVIISADGRQIYKLDVTRDKIVRAIRDICASAGTTVTFGLDNTITISWNTVLGAGGWPEVFFYWTRANSRSVKFTRQTRTAVAQVIVKLTNLEEEETFEASWPSVALPLGDIIEHNDSLLVSDTDDAISIAQMRFNKARLTDTVQIIPKGIAEWILPGQRHVVTFDVDGDNTYLNGHNVVVTSVTHSINLGDADGSGKEWSTDVQARRVEYA